MDEQWAYENSFRVAVVHSFYGAGQPSGENRVVEHQVEALRRAGYAVGLFAQHTDQRSQRKSYPLDAAATVATGRGASPLGDLHEWQPDVVHVHNLFPNFGRSWVNRWRGPLVATMHNFRPLCAAATFYREGQVCTDCLDRHSSFPAVLHGCYRGSRAATLPVAAGVRFGSDPVLARADRVVVLNEQARRLYERAGMDADRLSVMSNFLPDPGPPGPGGDRWLYVGRLSEEKGILDLMREWPTDMPLDVVGVGPLADEVAAAAPSSVRVLGGRTPDEVGHLMRHARGLVFPSRWFEGFPMVYLEALAAGTPVLAWHPSSVVGLVERDGTGAVVDRNLADVLEDAEQTFPTMRDRCRQVFEDRYTEAAWVAAMREVYDEALAVRGVGL